LALAAVGHPFDVVRQPVNRIRDRGGCVVPGWFAIPGTVSPYPGTMPRGRSHIPGLGQPWAIWRNAVGVGRRLDTGLIWSVNRSTGYGTGGVALSPSGLPYPGPYHHTRDRIPVPRNGIPVPRNHAPWSFPHPRVGTTLGYTMQRRWRWRRLDTRLIWSLNPSTAYGTGGVALSPGGLPYPGPYPRTRNGIPVPRNHAPWSFPHPRVGTTLGYTMQRRWRWTGDASIDESPHSQRYRSSNSMRCFCNRDRSSS